MRFRKGTAYYSILVCFTGLCFGLAVLILTGGPLVTNDEAAALHNNPAFVTHESGPHLHELTPLGELVYGRPALAHVPTSPPGIHAEDAQWYCGHGSKFATYNGILHKMVFLRHLDNGRKHKWKTAHYRWNGIGYSRSSQWWYSISRCH